MSSPKYLIFIGIILLWDKAMISNGQPLDMEHYYNIIEPNENDIEIMHRIRGSVNVKELILTLKRLETKPKQYWISEEDKPAISETESKLVTTLPKISSDSTVESLPDAISVKNVVLPTTYDNPPRLANVHEQVESDQKRFFHTALDGWIF